MSIELITNDNLSDSFLNEIIQNYNLFLTEKTFFFDNLFALKQLLKNNKDNFELSNLYQDIIKNLNFLPGF